MRVATSTGQSVQRVLRAPYLLTLWTFLHLTQRDTIEQYNMRAIALYQAGLNSLAFNEPKKLADEHRRLQAELEPPEDADTARARALAFAEEIATVDRAGAWEVMEEANHG